MDLMSVFILTSSFRPCVTSVIEVWEFNMILVFQWLGADFLLILLFYYLLAFTGIFTFANLQDLYTLNFQFDRCPTGKLSFAYILQVRTN